jgi:Tol biopolymer transport system component
MLMNKLFNNLYLLLIVITLSFAVSDCSFLELENFTPDKDFVTTSTISADAQTPLTITTDPILFDAEGMIVFSDLHGLYTFDVKKRKFEILLKDNSQIYENAIAIHDWVYFLCADQRKSDPAQPAGGGFGPFQLFKIHRNGGELQQIISNENINILNFSISPDEKYLSYSIDSESSTPRYQLVLLDLESNKSLLIHGETRDPFVNQIWSPNNEILLFFNATFPGDAANPVLYDVSKNKATELLSEGQVFNTRLAWSPDGREIVLGKQVGQTTGVYYLDTNTKKENLGISTSAYPENLTWSPDGDRVLFEVREKSETTSFVSKLYLLDVKTKEIEKITEDKFTGKFFSYNAIWSPDSQYFAYFIRAGGEEITLRIVSIHSLQSYDNKLDGFYADSATWVTNQ